MSNNTNEMDNWMDLVGAVVAVIALIISIWNYFHTRRLTKINLSTELLKVRQELYRELRKWSEEVIKIMTESSTFCELNPERMDKGVLFDKYLKINNDLSFLLDKGRLFLANTNENEIGLNKSGAYRGLRQPALDKIAEFIELSLTLNYLKQEPNKKLQKVLNTKKREFVTEVQTVLQVRNIEIEFRELSEKIGEEIK